MRKIGITTVYGAVYEKDKLFIKESCNLSDDLLIPNIMLKAALEESGCECHTMDMFKTKEISDFIFCEMPIYSILGRHSIKALAIYILKAYWRKDYLLYALLKGKNTYLISTEPPIIVPESHDQKKHKYFNKVFAWADYDFESDKYVKLYPPVVRPEELPNQKSFQDKRFLTLIASNKNSAIKGELYSKRRQVINYFEGCEEDFDLFGYGWEAEKLHNYKGSIASKRTVLADYKFCICYENLTGINDYVTEKIMDCFFVGCVPVYWGAENVSDLIPYKSYVDMRDFGSVEEMHHFLKKMTEEQYNEYLNEAKRFLDSDSFRQVFSAEHYVRTITETVLGKED